LNVALIANADSPLGLWSAETLAGIADRVIAAISTRDSAEAAQLARLDNVEWIVADCTTETGWQVLSALPEAAAGTIDAIVHCPPRETTDAAHLLTAAWLAQKHAHPFMAARRGGILVTQCLASAPGAPDAALDSALAGTRLAATAALLDAMKLGLAPRTNRLIFAPIVQRGPFQAALSALLDDRSSFMTGAELALDGPGTSADPRLDGKTLLVTGATSGIGRATAIEIGRSGGWVAIGGRKRDLAGETLALVRAAGGDGMVVTLDVTRTEVWASAVAQILDARGVLHGLVNNAGESRNKPIDALTAADLRFLLDINLGGTRNGIAACLEAIAASGGGGIVNVSSVAGLRAAPGGSAYGASKAAVIGLSESWARSEARARGVRINALSPGLIWSDSVADSLGEQGAADFRTWIEPKTPLGRVGAPEEVGRMIAFLLSDAAASISGQAISVSGGLEFNLP